MKTRALLLAIVLLGPACDGNGGDPDATIVPPPPEPVAEPADEPFREMRPQPAPAAIFAGPAVDRFRLGSGPEVILVERHTVPLVSWTLEFPTGSESDPAGKEGLAGMCMWLLIGGGPADSVDRLADMSSTIQSRWGLDAVAVEGFALRAYLDPTLDLWTQTLTMPGMSEGQLDWVRRQSQTRLLQSQADPFAMSRRILAVVSRGKGHPYARLATADSYGRVTVDDCRQFRDSLGLASAHLYVAGDITHDEVAARFGGPLAAPGTTPPLPVIPPSIPDPAPIVFADAPGASQAVILMWGPGPTRRAADYYAASVMAAIFAGDSLTSRLGASLREMMGSTYSVSGALSFSKTDGQLVVSAPVQSDRAAAAITAMRAGAAAMREADVSDEELARARDGRISGLPFLFVTARVTLSQFMNLLYYELPFTYYQDYAANFGAVDKDAVRRAAQAYLVEDNLRFVVVGDRNTVLPQLRHLAATIRIVDGNGNPAP
jgi:predicted Zn-dependent peptidase